MPGNVVGLRWVQKPQHLIPEDSRHYKPDQIPDHTPHIKNMTCSHIAQNIEFSMLIRGPEV